MHNLYCVCRAADSYNVSAPFAVKIYRSKNEGSCVSRAVKSKDIRSQTLLSDEPLSSEYGQAHPRSRQAKRSLSAGFANGAFPKHLSDGLPGRGAALE